MKVKLSELKPGDKVKMFDGPYSTATVSKVKDGTVTLFRPYAHYDEDVSICYVGLENYSTSRTDQTWEVIS